jgi:hypothetical protein
MMFGINRCEVVRAALSAMLVIPGVLAIAGNGGAWLPAPQFHKFKVRTDCSQMSLQGEGDQARDPVAAARQSR